MMASRVRWPVTTTITDRSTVSSRAKGSRMLTSRPRTMDWEMASYMSIITRVMVRKAAAAENQHPASPARNSPGLWRMEM